MKLLFTDSHDGYSFSTRSTYYLCETEEEYQQQVEYCKRWKERAYGDSWIGIDTTITCTPHTQVSDGFAVSGGHELKAKGCYTAHSEGFSTSRTTYDYYIKPNSIIANEKSKTQSWWV